MSNQTEQVQLRLKNVIISLIRVDPYTNQFACGQRLRRELKVWRSVRHDNIVPLWGTVEDFPTAQPGTGLMSTGMVSPWMDNGNLTDYLEKNSTLETGKRLDIVRNVTHDISNAS